MIALRYLIEKEFKLIARNKFLPRLIVIMPTVMIAVLPFAANLEVRNINLAVVDRDRTTTSAALVEQISSSEYFNLVAAPASYAEAMEGVEEGTTDLVVDIPPRFTEQLTVGPRPPQLQLSVNAVNAIKAGMGANYAGQIVGNFAQGYRSSGAPTVELVDMQTQNRFNPYLNYRFYMVPALMVMLLTVMCSFLPAVNIVSEKETGTIEQMNVTPVGRWSFILSKIIPYWIIGFVVLNLCFLVAWLLYGLVPVGSVGTIYAGAMLFILTVTGYGLLISNYSSTLQQAMFVMFFVMIILILLSGLFTPVAAMPEWAQGIAACNPLTYFIRVMRGVYLKGSNLADVWLELTVLAGYAAAMNAAAMISYRKRS